jgi:hypothetical protein
MIKRNEIGYRIGESHPRGAKYPDWVVEKARRLDDNDMTPGQIARLMRVPQSTVRGWVLYQRRNQV